MEEKNILNGGAEELKEVKQMLEKRQEAKLQTQQCAAQEQKLEKQIAGEERQIKIEIEQTVTKRRNEITRSYDKEIAKEKEVLKGVKGKRDKAKSKGMKERMESETAHLAEENRGLHGEIRTAFGNRGIPAYCDSAWFYALFMPKRIKEFVAFILAAIAALVVLPNILIFVIGGRWWLKIIVYILTVLLVAAVYVTIYLFTKDKDSSILTDMREKRNRISDNEKEIRKIRRDIRKDKDDSVYHLDEFDEKIKASEQTISDIVVKKNEALAEFENTTKSAIENEITGREQEKMNGLREELGKLKQARGESEQKEQEIALFIASHYEALLGKDMMTPDKIEEMIRLLSEGQAATVSEAINKIRATTA